MAFDLTQIIAAPSFAPSDWQSAAPREAYGHRAPVSRSRDLERVLALPRRALELDGTERAEAIIDMITERYSRGPRACRCAEIDPDRHAVEGCIDRLRLVQALALREIGIVGGLLGPIGVGHGKTLIDLLAALAFAHHAEQSGMGIDLDKMLCVLLVPPGLVVQLANDRDYIGEHFHMPTIIFQGAPHLDRVMPGMPKLQVMPYSRIQRAEATSWLKVVRPHAIIADECHKLRNRNTATTSRVMNYFEDCPHTRLAAWSGSITSKSIKDYAHLSALALKLGSPLPIDYDTVEDWARAIDPSPNAADPGPLLDGLMSTGCCRPGESLYLGIRRRVTETLGVVSTSTPAVDCELELLERTAPDVPESIRDLISRAMGFERPDGEELVTAMQAVECACQIACGFHYRWIYPHNVFPRDTFLVLDWLEKRKAWHKELRQKLKSREEHLDSPQLCEYAAQRALGLRPPHKGLPIWHSLTYREWHEVKYKVRPESDAVWLDDFLVNDAAEWAHSHHGLIWYQHSTFGERLSQVAQLPMFGGGKEAKRGLLAERGDRSVIVSIKAHGTGTNGLQFYFNEQLYGTNPADPAAWEQSLGRLHRANQRAEIVRAWFYMHTAELRKHVKAALRAALYVEGTMGSEQKLRVGFPLDIMESFDEEDDAE